MLASCGTTRGEGPKLGIDESLKAPCETGTDLATAALAGRAAVDLADEKDALLTRCAERFLQLRDAAAVLERR